MKRFKLALVALVVSMVSVVAQADTAIPIVVHSAMYTYGKDCFAKGGVAYAADQNGQYSPYDWQRQKAHYDNIHPRQTKMYLDAGNTLAAIEQFYIIDAARVMDDAIRSGKLICRAQ